MADDKLYKAFRIAELLKRQVTKDSFTADEQAEIDQWLAANEGNRTLFERISNESQLAFDLLELQDTDTERELVKVGRRLQGVTPPKRTWYWVAATLFALLSVGLGMYWYGIENEKSTELVTVTQDDALPGGNRATLTLANGRTIDLNETQGGIVVGDGVTYLDGSEILDIRHQAHLMALTTPRAGTYQITLPDGTNVWLNAESTLRYPSRFSDKERVVELEGEAYFEVSKSANLPGVPFLIKTKGQTIEVVGTQFNVSAYAAETTTKTTLVEGRVRVTTANSLQPQVAILEPGQQSILDREGMIVNQVDVAPFVAWKEGYFYFQSTPFADVLAQISRWYDIELVYEGGIPSQTFTGKMSRNVSMNNVLKLFKGSGIHFRFADQKLFIE